MHTFLRGLLAATMLCLPSLAHAGGYCYTPRYYAPAPVVYTKPAYVAPQPITQISYTYNLTQPAAVQGNTVYGTPASYSTLAQVYGQSDLGALYSQAIRLTSDAQTYGAQANAGVQSLVAQAGQERARIAEIVAKGQAASQALAAAAPANSASVQVSGGQQYSQQTASASVGNVAAAAGQLAVDANTLATIHATYCASCHATAEVAATKGGKAVIPPFDQLDAGQRKIVRDRVATHSAEKRMPKNSSLTDAELSVLLDALCK